MNEKKFQPTMGPMNSEEAQRYNGIRQALMNLPDNMADPNRVANPYGVYYPDPMAVKMAQEGDQSQPVQGGEMPNGGITPGGMPLPAVDGDMGGAPVTTGMMPQPGMMPQANPMQQNPMQKRGLGRLMAGLAGQSPMMRG